MHWEPFLSPPPAGKDSTNSKCCRMWFPFTDICLLVGTLKVCWDQEIADYPLQRTNPFKPFKDSPAHVDHSLFLSGQAKLVLGLVKKDEENYYETVVTNAEQSGAVTHTSKQAFHLDSPANIHGGAGIQDRDRGVQPHRQATENILYQSESCCSAAALCQP